MRAESIVEAQAKIFREVLHFEELPFMGAVSAATAQQFGAETAAAIFVDHDLLNPLTAKKARRPNARVQEAIALGTTPGSGDDGLELAVLVQNRKLLNSDAVDRIKDIAKNEVDVLYIGRQQPL